MRRRSRVARAESIKKSIEGTEDQASPVGQLPLSREVEHSNSDKEVSYETKGAFRLKRKTGNFEFRFPKSLSQPEPIWCPGDGFSSDEARPNFIFSMTGTHKQRRSQPLPGVGKLPVESERVAKEDDCGQQPNRSRVQYLTQYDLKNRRSTAKEIWPTLQNFTEDLVVRERNPMVLDNEVIIRSTVSPEPTPVPRPREAFGYVPPTTRKRKHSDFENFGRRHQDRVPTPFVGLESQGTRVNQSGSSSDEDDEDEDEEIEREYSPDEVEFVPATRYDEGDNEDEESSQHEEDPSSVQSREPSPEGGLEGSASSDQDAKPEGTEWDQNHIPWAAGDVARQMLQHTSQAFS